MGSKPIKPLFLFLGLFVGLILGASTIVVYAETVAQYLKNGVPVQAGPITPTAGFIGVANGTAFSYSATGNPSVGAITGGDTSLDIVGKAGSVGSAGYPVTITGGAGSGPGDGGNVGLVGGTNGGGGIGGYANVDAGTGGTAGTVTIGTANAGSTIVGRVAAPLTLKGAPIQLWDDDLNVMLAINANGSMTLGSQASTTISIGGGGELSTDAINAYATTLGLYTEGALRFSATVGGATILKDEAGTTQASFLSTQNTIGVTATPLAVNGVTTFANRVTIAAPLTSTPATVQDVSTGNTITLPTASFTKRLTATAGAATGVIVTAGTTDGQILNLFNVHATNAITMAVAATSNVANGVSCSISALSGVSLVWDATSSRWYQSGSSGSSAAALEGDVTLTDNTAADVVTMTLTNGTAGGYTLHWTIRCDDGTDFQVKSGTTNVAVYNKAGTYSTGTNGLVTAETPTAASSGTLTVTWALGIAGDLEVTADSSLTTTSFRIDYEVINTSVQTLTLH